MVSAGQVTGRPPGRRCRGLETSAPVLPASLLSAPATRVPSGPFPICALRGSSLQVWRKRDKCEEAACAGQVGSRPRGLRTPFQRPG